MTITALTASAAGLDVDGGVIQVFEPEVNIQLPGEGGASVKITPQNLNAASNGPPLEAQLRLTGACSQDDIVVSSITLGVAGEHRTIPRTGQVSRNPNKLIVRFDRQAVINLIGDYQGNTVTLVVRGRDATGCEFAGADTIGYKSATKGVDSGAGDGSQSNSDAGGGDEAPPPVEGDGSEPTTDDTTTTDTTTTDQSGTDGTSGSEPSGSEPGPTDAQ
ncbi:MAG TPA: hypothetical protein VFV93_15195 [Thermomicrobiales bacterium]|nr:hypothetical protein [Thermomicrobiales bacterium]